MVNVQEAVKMVRSLVTELRPEIIYVPTENDREQNREHWSRIDEQARGPGAHGLLARVERDVVNHDPSETE